MPVKIRNMSASGALVEGAAVPDPRMQVRLVRGSLSVPGIVVWAVEGRCGLRFSSIVSVRDWLAPPAKTQQQRVDDVVQLVKTGAVPLPLQDSADAGATCRSDSSKDAELAEDLRRVSRLIEILGDELTSDEAIVGRFGNKLQDLDIALQTITAVANSLAGGPDAAGSTARLQNLRTSCAEALKRPG